MTAIIDTGDPRAVAAVDAIHDGDTARLRQLCMEHPLLASAALGTTGPGGMTRSLLHVATDWPGHYPNVAATIAVLVDAGADVHARFTGPHTETPLHWAASSNDVAALDALLDAGADIEAAGAIFTGGAPLSDAVVFANWDAARRLVERGARPTWWQAAALGAIDIVRARWDEDPAPTHDEITRAFWHACRAAQRVTAQYLLERGANVRWIGWDHKTPLQAAEGSGNPEFVTWLRGVL